MYDTLHRLILLESTLPSVMRFAPPEAAEFIRAHCGPWLQQAQGGIVWRGVSRGPGRGVKRKEERLKKTRAPGGIIIRSVRQDRLPRDSTTKQHEWMKDEILQQDLVASRHNSVFVTGDIDAAQEYATSGLESTYAIFPIGPFHYTWTEDTADPMDDPSLIDITWRGDDNSLPQAIKSGHEIMIHCAEVAMIRSTDLMPQDDNDE